MIHPLTSEELVALSALLAGARTVREVARRGGKDARVTLRSMELREPSLVVSQPHPALGEVWGATVDGVSTLKRARASGRTG
ncbi:MAG: hypothetical protein QOK19_1266 [Solirubrobacteraceae bacterium]|jgi:hypothetical protein|nr:hypothetical protein [Solirubrobacterales bacterium]MEA2215705.1 hypothetical protein [Solirubrobacteraceae bacterium]